jgi:dTDP-4-amino-4,6-dideoxygalactose transaminase
MNIPMINLKAQYAGVRKELLGNLKEILAEQKLILGPYGAALEKTIAGYTGVSHAVACANGTDALILSLMALGIGDGDEVITTPYTFFATASSIALVGAKPVFVDIEPQDMNINPDLIEAAITPRTKAIIVVHLFGKVCDMGRIGRIGEKHGIPVVEDMAQSLGAKRDGVMCGAFGDIAAISFYPTKNLGGIGEGGMVLTRRKDLGERATKLRVHGMGSTPYQHEMIGINSRLDEIKACALVVKFPHLESWNEKRRRNAAYYNRAFRDLSITLPVMEEEVSHIFHQYVMRMEDRDGLQAFLKGKGIQTGIYYPVPLHLQECFGYLGYRRGSCPVAEEASRTSLALPVFPELKRAEKKYIVDSVRGFFSS